MFSRLRPPVFMICSKVRDQVQGVIGKLSKKSYLEGLQTFLSCVPAGTGSGSSGPTSANTSTDRCVQLPGESFFQPLLSHKPMCATAYSSPACLKFWLSHTSKTYAVAKLECPQRYSPRPIVSPDSHVCWQLLWPRLIWPTSSPNTQWYVLRHSQGNPLRPLVGLPQNTALGSTDQYYDLAWLGPSPVPALVSLGKCLDLTEGGPPESPCNPAHLSCLNYLWVQWPGSLTSPEMILYISSPQ